MTGQQLAKQQRPEMTLAMVSELTGYQAAEIALISRTVAVGAPLQELAVFLHACRTLGLDPLLRQAYWIRRMGSDNIARGTLQVGIDGFRGLADRQGNYAGSSEPVFRGYLELAGHKGVLVPEYCQVTTWKIVGGHKAAFTGEARWTEFYPGEKPGAMWRKMPHHMLAKVAEAQSLRKGWPATLGSMSLDDDDVGVSVEELPTVAAPVAQPQARPRRTMSPEEYDRTFYGAESPERPPASMSEAPDPTNPAEDE